uniref:chitinase n=1 Tax=Ananas comosus var. bracteatus TaxID=296719 RepID=A0A6V7NRQ5_ANACO|nr:unnamed protein product [Ananas comosus var. bracteatus]
MASLLSSAAAKPEAPCAPAAFAAASGATAETLPFTATTAVRASVPSPPATGFPALTAAFPAFRALAGSDGVASIISSDLFDEMLKHRNDAACPAHEFYQYEDFIAATNAFVDFGTTGDLDTRKREIAAFLAQTSHETTGGYNTGGWPTAPDGPYAWGYCFLEELGATADYCVPSTQWPCAAGKEYYGRGPIQISYNFNYGLAGEALGVDLLNNPDLVATNPTISFETALWFWMTPQPPMPSWHDVITDRWTPSAADISAGRLPGYGVITNIINGGLECGHGPDSRVADRIGFYKRYCDILGVSYGITWTATIRSPLIRVVS